MEAEGRSYSNLTPTMSVIPNNAHQTVAASPVASTPKAPVEIIDADSPEKPASSAQTPIKSASSASSSYAISDIQMVDVQYGSVANRPVSEEAIVAPPWPANSTTTMTKSTAQVSYSSGFPSGKTHTVVVDITKDNDSNIPALMSTGDFGPNLDNYFDISAPGSVNLKRLFKALQEHAGKKSQEVGEKVSQIINNLVSGRITLDDFKKEMAQTTDYPIKDCLIPLIKDNLAELKQEFMQAQTVPASPVSTTPSNPRTPIASLLGQQSSKSQQPVQSMQSLPSSQPVKPAQPMPSSQPVQPSQPMSSSQPMPPSQKMVSSQPVQPSQQLPSSQPMASSLSAPPPYTQGTGQIMQQNNNTLLRRKRPRNLQDLNSLGETVSPDITVVSWQDSAKRPKLSTPSLTSETPAATQPQPQHHSQTPVSLPSATPTPTTSQQQQQDGKPALSHAEEWKHVDQMMWCIIGMVEKTRQAINVIRGKHQAEVEALKAAKKSSDAAATAAADAASIAAANNSNNKSIEQSALDTSKAVEIAIAAVKHQAEIDKQRIMAQADLKCKEEIQRARREMENRMLKAQQATVDHQQVSHHQESVEMVTTPIVQRTNITNEGSSSSTMVATPVPAPAPTPPGNMVAGIEKQQIVEEAERRCRGELEHMRREIETLKDSLSEQVDSEDYTDTPTRVDGARATDCREPTCWNCGRVARDKCSGCGKACYCGRFCQHKHWSTHQLKCLQYRASKQREQERSHLWTTNPPQLRNSMRNMEHSKSAGSNNVSYTVPAVPAHQNSSRSMVPVATPTAVHPITSHSPGLNYSNSNNDVIIIPSLQPAHVTYVNKAPLTTSYNPVRPHHDLSHMAPNSNHMQMQKDIVIVHQQQAANQIQSPVVTMIPLDNSKMKVANPMAPDMVAISSPTHHSRLYNSEPSSSS
ncbi:protein CBFA2T1-like isoform X3 [Dysidea avara]|uniref:protein CBFA2T1-like isoform X3 n=1 Tax=Dysidea avara TaxID=196820 RepID=UPI0033337DCD